MSTSLSSHAAPTQGPTSKTTRTEAATSERGPIHFNLNFLPWRKASAARQAVETTVVRTQPAPAPEPVVKGSSYLPVGGSIPLRFASARTWPDRMTPADEASLTLALAPDPDLAIRRDALKAQQVAGVPGAPTVTPPESAPIVTTASSSAAAEYREPQVIQRPVFYGVGEAVLTTDLVLQSLDRIPSERGAVPGQFRPAVPQERSVDSVPVAVAP